ncbi:MAG: protein-disulfide reductase DsbD family protein [Pirellulales bacterium]
MGVNRIGLAFARAGTLAPALALLLLLASPALAQFGPLDGQFGGLGGSSGGDDLLLTSAQFTAGADGQPARLFVTAQIIKPGWHIYSITQPAGGPVRTKIVVEPSKDFQLLGPFEASVPPEKKPEPAFNNLVVESHYGQVTWFAPIKLAAGVDPAKLTIQGKITAQACTATSCMPPEDYKFAAALGPGMKVASTAATPPDAGPSAAPPAPAEAKTPVAIAGKPTAFDPAALVIEGAQDAKNASLAVAMFFGFLGGLILNLMPCVLPVIGLKLLSFVQQSGESRQRAFWLNIWYSLGLMSVFMILASLAALPQLPWVRQLGWVQELGWGQLFTYSGFNIALAAVVFAMGLSFLGVWEIPIPGFVGSGKAGELAAREGVAGAFAKGVLTTILATPCSGPGLAYALAWVVGQPPRLVYAVFASIGLGMASPYLVIGAFPGLIRFLPKPGAWMETFKEVMGFVLLATVVYLLTIISWIDLVPTVALLFGLWGACWWIGRVPPTVDLSVKASAWLEAAAFAGVIWMIAFPGIDELVGGRFSFRGLQDIMASRFERAVTGKSSGAHELAWQPFSRKSLEDLTASKKTVLVDFTADWCLTCKSLEGLVLNTPETGQLVKSNGVVALQADWTRGAPEVTEMLSLLGSKQVPVLAIFPAGKPNTPIVLRGFFTQQQLLDALTQAGPSQSGLPATNTALRIQ